MSQGITHATKLSMEEEMRVVDAIVDQDCSTCWLDDAVRAIRIELSVPTERALNTLRSLQDRNIVESRTVGAISNLSETDHVTLLRGKWFKVENPD